MIMHPLSQQWHQSILERAEPLCLNNFLKDPPLNAVIMALKSQPEFRKGCSNIAVNLICQLDWVKGVLASG